MSALSPAHLALVPVLAAPGADTSKAGTAITIIVIVVLVVVLAIGAVVLFRRRNR